MNDNLRTSCETAWLSVNNMVQIAIHDRMLRWLLHAFLIPRVKPSQQTFNRILLWIVWSVGRVWVCFANQVFFDRFACEMCLSPLTNSRCKMRVPEGSVFMGTQNDFITLSMWHLYWRHFFQKKNCFLLSIYSLLYQICRGLIFRVTLTPFGSNFYYDNAFTYIEMHYHKKFYFQKVLTWLSTQ